MAVASHGRTEFLCVATPGAGKTNFALHVLHDALSSGSVARIVVVTPTTHLRKQWAEAAHRVGIELDPTWENDSGPEARDFHGVVISYAQLATNPDVHRFHAGRATTYVVFDEPHHGGDGRKWGDAMRRGFEPARFKLLLSGTPFRSDNNPIPFVRYEDNRSCADFTFGYKEALRAGNICRDIYFPSYEGKMSWLSQGKLKEARFADEASEREARERLRTAISIANPWPERVIHEADIRLREIRQEEGHPGAGGLIIAMDQPHAQGLADMVTRITGRRPALAVSDVPDASDVITRFAKSDDPWLIAVRMVSEGVDIPRLRVGVYLTNVASELFFRQAVGRFVRWQDQLVDVPQPAYLYVPKDERLIAFVEQIKEERQHELQEELEEEQERERREQQSEHERLSDYLPIDAEAYPDSWFLTSGDSFSQTELTAAHSLAVMAGAHVVDIELAKILRFQTARKEESTTPSPNGTQRSGNSEAVYQEKERLKKRINRLVASLHECTGEPYNEINARLIRLCGASRAQATVEQLRDQERTVIRWLAAAGWS